MSEKKLDHVIFKREDIEKFLKNITPTQGFFLDEEDNIRNINSELVIKHYYIKSSVR